MSRWTPNERAGNWLTAIVACGIFAWTGIVFGVRPGEQDDHGNSIEGMPGLFVGAHPAAAAEAPQPTAPVLGEGVTELGQAPGEQRNGVRLRAIRSEPAPFCHSPGAWDLVFAEEFDGDVDARWDFQNGPSGHILSSRWRENMEIKDGVARLVNRHEQRGGQEWTSASMWTKRKFTYGYFECRYCYADAPGVNNSFWIFRPISRPARKEQFELDINEGHHPNIVNTNIHWVDDELARRTKAKRFVPEKPLSKQFHTFGFEWNDKDLIWYFEGEELRREPNTFAHAEASVYLSAAIMNWAGPVTDAIDGTSMDVDYVRVWQRR